VSSHLCLDCVRDGVHAGEGAPRRCPACGSPRVVAHAELDALSVAHIDCDAFYAAIEKRDDPSLADRPVIVGGGRRGVAMTACYVARTYGVRSAMPMFEALRRCPDAVIVRPDMRKYAEVGRAVRERMRALTPLVEPLSIDEAFLDLSGTRRLHGAAPAVVLARFAQGVQAEFGITVSIGLSYAKFLAKIASDLQKPRGFSVIGRAEARAFLGPRPVTTLPGVGEAAARRLAERGFTRLDHLAGADPRRLEALLGRDGSRLAALARGEDARHVRPSREAKGISAETTFPADLADFAALRPILWRLSERVATRLKREGLAAGSVVLKLKDAQHRLRTRSRSGLAPTQLADRLFAQGEALLRAECDGTAFRLIGIGTNDLSDAALADRGDLADVETPRRAKRDAAVEAVRARFGEAALQRGIAFGAREPAPVTNPDRPSR
jgi:DNA polymerase IV